MFYRIAQLQLTPSKKTDSIEEIFVAEPDTNREHLAGKLFVLLSLASKDSDYVKFANFLINELHHQYYQSEKMVLRERLSTIKIDHIFESALAKTNKNLATFIQNEKLRLDARAINATIGVIFENELHFTTVGGNRAFLIYKKTENDSLNYKISEVTQEDAARAPDSLQKLFSSVVSGVLPEAGYFLFANETLPEYLSTRQLADIISTLPPSGAMEQIKNQLENINSYVPFLALLIKNVVGAKIEYAPVTTSNASASLSSLHAAEANTEKLLAPSGVVDVKSWLARLKIQLPFLGGRTAGLGSVDNTLLKDKVFFKKRPSFKLLIQLASWLKYAVLGSSHLILSGFRSLVTPDFWRKLSRLPGVIFRLTVFGSANWFKSLGLKYKILVGILVVALTLFIINSLTISQKNQVAENGRLQSELTNKINERLDQVEAAFIYNNETGAKEILPGLKTLINQLAQTTETEKAAFMRFDDKYHGYLERLKHLVKIDRPTELADFSKQGGEAANLVLLNKKLYAADKQSGNIYVYSLADKTTVSVPAVLTALKYPNASGDNLLYYAGDAIWQFNTKTNKLGKLALATTGDPNSVKTMGFYNNKLYLLNAADRQIYRLNRSADSFVSPSNWLKPAADIASATSMFIDGNIYVLSSDGSAIKFLKGEPEPFELEKIEPTFTRADKIIITEKQNYIYVVESAQNRLAAFNKNGKFLKQYELRGQSGLVDVVLDEAAKKIYWLAGNKLLETTLEYF